MANSTLSDLMQREKDVMEENIAARRRESHFKDKDDNEREKKKIFISYRTRYYTTEDEPQKSRYGGKYNIVDVAERIKNIIMKSVMQQNGMIHSIILLEYCQMNLCQKIGDGHL